jgi:hypothetical protein
LNCRNARLVYLAPASMRNAQRLPPESLVEWLTFGDLPETVDGELAFEWTIIRRDLLKLDNITRNSRNGTQELGGRRNYVDTCRFDEVLAFCAENGNKIVVGFDGGIGKMRSATLDELKNRRAFKWDYDENGAGFKDRRNWIPGQEFLDIANGLLNENASLV